MAPSSIQQVLLSPAELAYLHTSLSLTPPIRPDGRSPTQFRPLIAESDILPGTNGSARICFADGTEAIVGVKAEIEKTPKSYECSELPPIKAAKGDDDEEEDENDRQEENGGQGRGENSWVELTVEIPGFRDDDSMPVFLAALLSEALLGDRELTRRLWINQRFHWKLYIDILLLSAPLSYPLPLLSLTSHLALLSTRLPKLKSERDEDPLFDDDWDASVFLYSRDSTSRSRPPITLLVMSVGNNIIFDPSREELAVAEVVLAISVGEKPSKRVDAEAMDVDSSSHGKPRALSLLAVRIIDPPARLTPPGVPNFLNTATGGTAEVASQSMDVERDGKEMEGVWQARRGGADRKMIAAMIGKVLQPGGMAEEVLESLNGVDLG